MSFCKFPYFAFPQIFTDCSKHTVIGFCSLLKGDLLWGLCIGLPSTVSSCSSIG